MKVIDTLMAFPGVLLAMMLIAVFGNGLLNTMTALSVMAIPRFARIARSGYMEYRDSDYYPECMYRALSLSTEFASLLGIPSNPLTEYFAAENRIPKHREMFVPESAWGPDRERIVRLRACEEALDKKEYGETMEQISDQF